MRTLLCLFLAAVVLVGCAAWPQSGTETPAAASSDSVAEPAPDAPLQPSAEPDLEPATNRSPFCTGGTGFGL